MEVIWDICLEAASIFVLILGAVGLVLSLLLVVSPKAAKSLGDVFNKFVGVEKKLSYLNRSIQTDRFTYQHNVLAGSALTGGSLFFLIFLFFRFDTQKALDLFAYRDFLFLYEILLKSAVLIGKIAGFAGVVFGLCLVAMPEIMVRIENKMDAWIATQDMVEKLDELHLGVDHFMFRYPLLFGFTGLMTSCILIILSVASLFGK